MATHVATQGHRTGPTTTAVSPKPGKVVTRTFRLTGYIMTYHQASGTQQLHGEFVAAVPSEAQPVDTPIAALDGVPVGEYVGVDPTTGYNAAYVAFDNGRILEITSSDATHDELVALLMSAQPTPIPVTGETGNTAIRDLGRRNTSQSK